MTSLKQQNLLLPPSPNLTEEELVAMVLGLQEMYRDVARENQRRILNIRTLKKDLKHKDKALGKKKAIIKEYEKEEITGSDSSSLLVWLKAFLKSHRSTS